MEDMRNLNKPILFGLSFLSLLAFIWALQVALEGKGAPRREYLVMSTGNLEWVKKARRGIITFGLEGVDGVFWYSNRLGGTGEVIANLDRSKGAEVSVLHEETATAGPIWSKEKGFWIYSLSIANRPVRSYEQIDTSIRSDKRWGYGLAVGFLMGAGLFALAAVKPNILRYGSRTF